MVNVQQETNEPYPSFLFYIVSPKFSVRRCFCCDKFTNFTLFSRQLNTDRHIIHGNLLISIAISQAIFLAGIEQTRNKVYITYNLKLVFILNQVILSLLTRISPSHAARWYKCFSLCGSLNFLKMAFDIMQSYGGGQLKLRKEEEISFLCSKEFLFFS